MLPGPDPTGSLTTSTVYNSMTVWWPWSLRQIIRTLGADRRWRAKRCCERVHANACAHGDTVSFQILTESAIMLWLHRLLYDRLSRSFNDGTSWNPHPRWGDARQHRLTSPHTSVKSLHLWRHQQVHGRSTTGEASHYLKKTLLGDLFVMPCVTMQSREMMSLSVKNTALWALKVHVGLGVVKLLVHGIIIVWTPYLAIFMCT